MAVLKNSTMRINGEKIKGLVNLNQKIVPIEKAFVPVLDHGFLYGDSIYETFRTFYGYPFQLQGHLDRLFQSAKGLELKIPLTKEDIKREVFRSIDAYRKKWGLKDELYIRVIISRGYGDIGFDPKLCKRPNFIIVVKRYIEVSDQYYEKGIHVIISSIIRNHPQAINPNIKSGNYLNSLLASLEALKQKAFDSVMLNIEGHVTELTTSNIFIVKKGIMYTPHLDCGILKGLTRTLILDIAKKNHLKLKETRITKKELLHSDECFLSSSLKRILPITRCNDQKIGSRNVGPLTQTMMTLFTKAIKSCLEKEYHIELP